MAAAEMRVQAAEDGGVRQGLTFLAVRLRALGLPPLLGLCLLTLAAALTEGVGLLLLLPLLDLVGVPGGRGLPPWLAGWLPTGLAPALAAYVLLVAAASAIVMVRTVVGARLRLALVDGVRADLHRGLLRLDWAAVQQLRRSDVNQAIMQQGNRCGFALDLATQSTVAVLSILAMLAATFTIAPVMTGSLLLLILAGGGVTLPLLRRTHRLGHRLEGAHRSLQAALEDDLAGLRVIRALSAETARTTHLQGLMQTLRRQQAAHVVDSARYAAIIRVAAAVTIAAGLLAATGPFGLPLADALVAIAGLARMLTIALRGLTLGQQLSGALPALEGVRAMLADFDAKAEATPTRPPPLGDIRLDQIAYAHAGGAGPALHAVSATLPTRGVTALIGPSGAGKSTLADILSGLTAPQAGRMLVGGQALDDGARLAWRAQVGHVPQDAFLFHDSVRNNLRLAAPDADDATLWQALDDAMAGDFVRALPQGLDSMVGDRGGRLSGGERQRLALARALLRPPRLLILDEATSALDAQTERGLIATLEALRPRMAVLVIAHRASMARLADHVLLLAEGRIVAAGDWPTVQALAGERLAALAMDVPGNVTELPG